MSRSIAGLLAVFLLCGAESYAKSKFDGTYVGDATARALGQKVTVPFSFKIRSPKLTGKILVPGANKVVTIAGSINGATGHYLGVVRLQFGISGQFTGRITRAGKLSGKGSLLVPGVGIVSFTLSAEKGETNSPYRGTWVATHAPGVPIIRVEVLVTPQGIASLTFTTSSNQTFVDNREVSDDGQINSVINGFIYFVKLNAAGTFTVSYQGVLGNGSLAGTRTTMGGVLSSLAGAYAAISNDPNQGAVKLRFVVANDRSLTGTFELRSGKQIPFTNIVGDMNDFAGTTVGGINYFAKIAGDGQFTLTYQSSAYGNGSFAGKKK